MMSDQTDKLFRDKLHGYQRPVPSEAWSQVSANLSHRKNLIWRRSAAAAIAVLCIAGVAIYPLIKANHTEIAQPVENSATRTESPLISKLPEPKPEKDAKTQESSITPPASAEETPAGRKPVSPKKPASSAPSPTNIDKTSEELPVIMTPEPESVAVISPPGQTSGDENSEQVIASGRKHITIVFTQTEVNEKYLSKTHGSDATSSDQEPSRLKNMLEKAYDLTHNQDPIGNLRQKKNEILAMNFRKGKPDTQND